jgi:opacity protein-like surface antigen
MIDLEKSESLSHKSSRRSADDGARMHCPDGRPSCPRGSIAGLIVCLIALGVCLASSPEASASPNRMGVRVGYHLYPSTPYLDRIEELFPARTYNGLTREFFFGYLVGEELGLEIVTGSYLPRTGESTYQEVTETGLTSVGVDMDVRVSYFLATAKIVWGGGGPIQPYVGGGLGHYYEKRIMAVTLGSVRDERRQGGATWGGHLVGGLDYLPSEWIGVCCEARLATATVEQVNNYGDDFDLGGLSIQAGTFFTW